MSTDSRGIQRGRCNNGACGCENYMGGSNGLKCMRCKHPPGKHDNLSTPQAYSSPSAATFNTGVSQPHSYAGVANSGTNNYGNTGYSSYPTYYNSQDPQMASPYQCQMCAADGCNNPAHYDNAVGYFDYCTPECRNRDLLPKEKKRLEDDLKSFSDRIRAMSASTVSRDITTPVGGNASSSGYSSRVPSQPHTVSGNSVSTVGHDYSTPTGGSTPGLSSTEEPARSRRGKQITYHVPFSKNPSKKLGLILSEEKFRHADFSGLLVLGVEYDTVAIHLLTSGDVHLLDVVTQLNGKEISPFDYGTEIRKTGKGSLTLNRSIALPDIDKLLGKAKFMNPTHVFVVMNPKDYPNCSIEKGFGLDTSVYAGKNLVRGISENTPARISRLKFDDEIVAHAFFNGGGIDVQKGYLEHEDLKSAASSGKTLILVVKRTSK